MHRLIDTKASKLDHLRKATHHGPDIIPIPTEVNIHRDFAIFTAISVYSTEWHCSSFTVTKMQHVFSFSGFSVGCREVICYKLLFSELKLVTDNLLSIYATCCLLLFSSVSVTNQTQA